MVASGPAYNAYAHDVLMPAMNPEALAEIQRMEAAGDTANPRFMELLIPNYYTQHILRMPYEQWPEPVLRMFKHINPKVYVPMQGPSEMGLSGALSDWDRTADLAKIAVPTLMVGARYDTMDPKLMERMSKLVPNGRYLYCPNGSHLAIYDDQRVYMEGVIRFLRDVDAGRMTAAPKKEPQDPIDHHQPDAPRRARL
jgi:proline iminopeptidase